MTSRVQRLRVLMAHYSVSHAMSASTVFRSLIAGGLLVAASGCHGLLDVSDPTLIRESDIANAPGANAQRLNVLSVLNGMTPVFVDVAKFTDELMYDGPVGGITDLLGERMSQQFEASQGTRDQHLGNLDRVFYSTSIAIPPVRQYTPDSLRGDFLAQLYAIRGYVVLQAAEDLCSGFPLNDVSVDGLPAFGGPLTTDSALALAGANLDSALKYVHDSTRVETLARVAKGRLLLNQGHYAEAAAVVHSVETESVYQVDNNTVFGVQRPNRWSRGGVNLAVGNHEGGNGLPFGSHDPRIPLALGGARAGNAGETLYVTSKYPSATAPISIATGIEARLIEAEAALNADDPNWITILNTLRQTQISPALPDLSAPATVAERVDLLYAERAFWLYITGRRLGDMRRLIKNYGRDPEHVFPTGVTLYGATFGTGTVIPFILAGAKLSNPNITAGCVTR